MLPVTTEIYFKNIRLQLGGCTGTYYSLMREWNEEVFL